MRMTVFRHTSIRYSIALSGLLYAARSARMTWSRSKPIDIISLTAFWRAEPVTKEGSPGATVDPAAAAGVVSVGTAALESVDAGAAGTAAGADVDVSDSVAVAGAGVVAAGVAAAGAAGVLAPAAVFEVLAAGVAFGCTGSC